LKKKEKAMTQIYVKYNPYRFSTVIKVNEQEIEAGSPLYKLVKGKRLQEWIAAFPGKLVNEFNEMDFNITFCGMELDWDDFKEAFLIAQDKKILKTVKLKYIAGKTVNEITKKIVAIFNDLQKGPIDDFRDEKFQKAFESIRNETFPVNVIATMSSGKSTLINALLGRKLMPFRNEACTATITEILDNGRDPFVASAYDRKGNKIRQINPLSYDEMSKLNEDVNVSRIAAEGDIPFLDSDDIALMLVDTPGPNNSQNQEHQKITFHSISSNTNSLILYVLNGTQLSTNDDSSLLNYVVEQIKKGGKQVHDRFLFVINKMDCFNPEEENIEKVIESARKYLSDHKIDDPQIFPCSAFTALNIRTCLKDVDTENLTRAQEKQLPSAARDTLPMINKFIEYESMHLEQYTTLAPSERQKLDMQLKHARAEEDSKEQALIHCGIYSIEAAIKTYVKKYAKTKKIKDLVETVQEVLESNQAMLRAKEQVAREASKVFAQRKANAREIISNGKEAQTFRDKINAINPIDLIEDKLEDLRLQIAKQASKAFAYYGDTIYNKDEAGRLLNYFAMLSLECVQKMNDELREFIYHELLEKSGKILSDYREILKKMDESVMHTPLYFYTKDYIEKELTKMVRDVEKWGSYAFIFSIIKEMGVVEPVQRSYYEKIGKTEMEVEVHGYYKTIIRDKYAERTETVEKFSIDVLMLHKRMITVLNKTIDNHIEHICSDIENQMQNMKNRLSESFNSVEQLIRRKEEELKQCKIDQQRMDEEQEKNRELLNWIESHINKMNSILDI